uniref:Uncharacterized protein n=1 Tax=Anguilla anguilla TaxID=7936 RepID=A0A0E9UVR7_ANGAN
MNASARFSGTRRISAPLCQKMAAPTRPPSSPRPCVC